jgi:hypothetical protein
LFGFFGRPRFFAPGLAASTMARVVVCRAGVAAILSESTESRRSVSLKEICCTVQ